MNSEYIASGPWKLEVLSLIGSECEAVSEVAMTGGRVRHAERMATLTISLPHFPRWQHATGDSKGPQCNVPSAIPRWRPSLQQQVP